MTCSVEHEIEPGDASPAAGQPPSAGAEAAPGSGGAAPGSSEGAPLNGAILVDKPAGITSARALRRLESIIPHTRIGHSGTLDPLATGLLVVLLGKGSRVQEIFLGGDKRYEGTILLGRATSTDDVAGVTIAEDTERRWRRAGSEPEIVRMLEERFHGTFQQRPPAVSAVKIEGERSYRRARRGETVAPAERPVTVYALALAFEGGDRLRYSVRASKGFYVRSLARDIGAALGSVACLESIRRTASLPFSVADALPLDELLSGGRALIESRLIPMETLVDRLPRAVVPEQDVGRLRHGDQSVLRGVPTEDVAGLVSLFDPSGAFLGLAVAETGELRVRFLM